MNEALTRISRISRISRDYRASALTASSADASRQPHLLTDVIQAVRGLAVHDANGTAIAARQTCRAPSTSTPRCRAPWLPLR